MHPDTIEAILRETVQLVWQAVGVGRRAYVFVNNRAEGNVLPLKNHLPLTEG